ncbi:major facilitator superfamily domain-containing protein [Bisporella sp. PMI_857]|nr:major facilitator superfamily domain-containing protein [Bisporella sp. PMI_857]
MADLLRESPLGQVIRLFTKNKILQYPEERPDFVVPQAYLRAFNEKDPNQAESVVAGDSSQTISGPISIQSEAQLQGAISKVLVPQRTSDGMILVDWYTTDDPANPQNWSARKRSFITLIICLYTFVVYCGSAIYVSSVEGVIQKFGVSTASASLPLSLYVLAYGIGPMVLAPLSEIPRVGRSPVYVLTFSLFVVLSIPTALVKNFAGLLVLRFLQGFFGSPCLANGGASLQDIYNYGELPYAMVFWVAAAFCGPALGPLLSGFAVMSKGWRWSLWEIVWMSAPVLVLMMLCLPETSTPNLLLRRAQRLRRLTGNDHILSQSEVDQRNIKPSVVIFNAIVKPLEITIKDPAIAFVNIYTSLTYGIYYSFFEVFALVYPPFYGFNIGLIGVVFLCVLVAAIIAMAIYCSYIRWYLMPDIVKNGMRAQEHRLVPALIGCFGPPIGLFLFAWSANPNIHWIAPTIGIAIYTGSVFIVLQCVFVYVPMSYPQYAASLFASNDFFRSALACGSIIYSRPLFLNLGIGKGVSLLGGLSCMGVIGMYILYFTGARLRAASKFATG